MEGCNLQRVCGGCTSPCGHPPGAVLLPWCCWLHTARHAGLLLSAAWASSALGAPCVHLSSACGLQSFLSLTPPAPACPPLHDWPQTFHLTAVTATVGGDYDVAAQKLQPKWQVDTALGKAVDLRVNEDGCTVSKNWDADLGALSCNVELKAHCTWNGRVRASCPSAPSSQASSSPAHPACGHAADAVH